MVKLLFVLATSFLFIGCTKFVYPTVHLPYYRPVAISFEATLIAEPKTCEMLEATLRTHNNEIYIVDKEDFETLELEADRANGFGLEAVKIVKKHNDGVGK